MRDRRSRIDPLIELVTPLLSLATGICLVLLLLLLCVSCIGCVQPTDEPPAPPTPQPVIHTDDDQTTRDDLTLTVAAQASLLTTLHELLGERGSVTVNPAESIVVARPQATLTIRPGSTITYDLTETGGSITFSDPRPTVSADVWGLKLTPQLTRLDLQPDNTGTAHVQSGPIKLSRRFALDWLADEQTGQPVESSPLPVVYLYSADWCGPCQQAITELSEAADLPFELRIIKEHTEQFPSWVTALPTFHWQASGGWKQRSGWPGLASFLVGWRGSDPASGRL